MRPGVVALAAVALLACTAAAMDMKAIEVIQALKTAKACCESGNECSAEGETTGQRKAGPGAWLCDDGKKPNVHQKCKDNSTPSCHDKKEEEKPAAEKAGGSASSSSKKAEGGPTEVEAQEAMILCQVRRRRGHDRPGAYWDTGRLPSHLFDGPFRLIKSATNASC